MRGYAWAPQHGVNTVEYRIDGGAWQRATIQAPNQRLRASRSADPGSEAWRWGS